MDKFEIIKKSINNWDPEGLFPMAPDDEYDYECKVLTEKIDEESPVEEIAKVISDLFSEMFEPASFILENCMEVAAVIKMDLLSQRKH